MALQQAAGQECEWQAATHRRGRMLCAHTLGIDTIHYTLAHRRLLVTNRQVSSQQPNSVGNTSLLTRKAHQAASCSIDDILLLWWSCSCAEADVTHAMTAAMLPGRLLHSTCR